MRKLADNFVVLDCETGGFDEDSEALLEIGAVDGRGREFNVRVCAGDKLMNEEALEVNGLDSLEARELGVSATRAMVMLFCWLAAGHPGRWIMGGKNPKFDFDFLKANWVPDHLGQLGDVVSRRTLDLHGLAYGWGMREGFDMTRDDFETDVLYDALGLPREPMPHHALRGARLEMLGFERLVLDREPTPERIAWALEDTREQATVNAAAAKGGNYEGAGANLSLR